jgi:MFS-type transporter involved in bile tolerance (Atg22 family)
MKILSIDFKLLHTDKRMGGKHEDIGMGTDEFFSICSMQTHQKVYHITILTFLMQKLRNTTQNIPVIFNITAACIKILKLLSIILIDMCHRNQSFNLNGSHFSYRQSNKFLQELTKDWKAVFDS